MAKKTTEDMLAQPKAAGVEVTVTKNVTGGEITPLPAWRTRSQTSANCQASHVTAESMLADYGRMFWFKWNALSGSYLRLTSVSRS
jgi:hypothetical protein